jgi:hypothetical protein
MEGFSLVTSMKADQEAQKVMSPEGATEEIRVLTAAISK